MEFDEINKKKLEFNIEQINTKLNEIEQIIEKHPELKNIKIKKKIYYNNLKNLNELKNISTNTKLDTVEKILDMYPELKKNKNNIVNNILGNKTEIHHEIILEKIILNNNSYYYDKFGFLFDNNINLVGCIEKNSNYTIYYLHQKYNKQKIYSDEELKKIFLL
jgi:hypothetical protein